MPIKKENERKTNAPMSLVILIEHQFRIIFWLVRLKSKSIHFFTNMHTQTTSIFCIRFSTESINKTKFLLLEGSVTRSKYCISIKCLCCFTSVRNFLHSFGVFVNQLIDGGYYNILNVSIIQSRMKLMDNIGLVILTTADRNMKWNYLRIAQLNFFLNEYCVIKSRDQKYFLLPFKKRK